jgi:hypothetical protein
MEANLQKLVRMDYMANYKKTDPFLQRRLKLQNFFPCTYGEVQCYSSKRCSAVFSQHLCSLPLSPIRNISLSLCALCLIPRFVLPVLISHKKRMMHKHDYH